MSLFAVAGVTGNTGAATAEALLARGHTVRVIVRDRAKAAPWVARGAEVAVTELTDAAGLTAALTGTDGAFLLNPPAYGSDDPIADAGRVGRAMAAAISASGGGRAVVLSSIAGHKPEGTGIILTNHALEAALAAAGAAVTSLRAPYFLENVAGVLPVVKANGVFPTLLAPGLDMPLIPVADIGAAAADILTGAVPPEPVYELLSAETGGPAEIAAALSQALGKPVQPVSLPRSDWEGVVAQWGLSPATQRLFIAMNEAINAGFITHEGRPTISGRTSLAAWAKGFIGA